MKTTKKSLWLCAVSMMLCVVMLLGTTFAWFTDSVMNKGNVIQAGELEITVQGYRLVDGKWVGGDYIKEDEPLFTETNWEPGQYGAIFLKVKNQGSLATEVNVDFNIEVGDSTAIYWGKQLNSLADIINNIETFSNEYIQKLGNEAKQIIKQRYCWDLIINKYENLFLNKVK